MSSTRFGELSIGSSGTLARVAPERGGLVTAFSVDGDDVLFLDEASFVDPSKNVRGGVPVLFPSPGKLAGDRYRRDGAEGSLGQHGFARNQPFSVIDQGADFVRMSLTSNETTRAVFPWEFSFALDVRVAPGVLHVDATISNTGQRPLPFGLGYHPYFTVPVADKAAARVPTAARRAFDNVTKREIPLTEIALATGEVDLHLLGHGRASAELVLPRGVVRLAGDDAWRRWVVWTLPGKDFVCVEPWTSPGDALNTGDDLITLAPGASRAFPLSISWALASSATR